MNINIQKWNPWNWFKHEDEGSSRGVSAENRGSAPSQSNLPTLFTRDSLWNMHREVDRMFDNLFELGGGLPHLFEKASGLGMLRPHVNIKETKKDYQITVEIPGVDESDIKLELTGNALTVKGEKRHEKAQEDENYSCIERSYGSFSRTLSLPADANEEGIEATFKSGVLAITVPRKQVAKQKDPAKVIDIKRAA
jgi:HSP20 family protein